MDKAKLKISFELEIDMGAIQREEGSDVAEEIHKSIDDGTIGASIKASLEYEFGDDYTNIAKFKVEEQKDDN